jgi:Rrf2 family transcriptional regulator, cysteine metabolism repressor
LRLSTEVRYAIRALCSLAILSREGGPVTAARLAEREDLSQRYLSLIFHQLKGAGYVKTVRGRRGGYELALRPEDITVASIICALEGPIAPVGCLLPPGTEESSRCPNKECCISRPAWASLQREMERTLGSITIASLVAGWTPAAGEGTVDHGC